MRLHSATVYSLIILGPLLLQAKQASAETRCKEVVDLSFEAPMQFCMRTGFDVMAVGVVTQNTPDDFLQFLSKIDTLGFTPAAVTFHSPGGNLFGGVILGGMIRERKLHTRVGQNSECSSACMIAFIGGRSRKVAHDGRIGNHQIGLAANHEVTNSLIAFLSAYHRKMNVSSLAVKAAMTRNADEMYWYSPDEMSEWGIVTQR